MEHHFNIEIAQKFGVDIAIFLQNLAFWSLKNIANDNHFHDNRYWVYNTQESYTVLFPYWTRQNIRTIITKCLEKNIIIKGNYNKLNYDRTTWYSFTDEGLDLFPVVKKAVDNSKSLGWNQPMDWLESTNSLVGINQPIPDNKPYNKQQIKSFCLSDEQKKNKAVDKKKQQSWKDKLKNSPVAGVTTQSTSYKPSKKITTNPEVVKAAMAKLPKSVRPKKYRMEIPDNA